MVRASARVLLFALGVSGSAAAAPSSNDSAAVPLDQPGAPLPPQAQPPPPSAGAAPQEDRAKPAIVADKPPEDLPKVPWHDTWLIFDNSVTAQTLGIGQSYQSSNPTYDMALSFRPRYYFYETKVEGFYASGRIDVVREFTNSDTTTAQGETLVGGAPHGIGSSDPTLFTVYRRRLAKRGDYDTTLALWAPIFTLPLSKYSQSNSTYLGLGTQVWLNHDAPLAGSRAAVFRKITFGGIVGYNHTFSAAQTATNPELGRVRMDPEGRAVLSDQLTGAGLPQHEVRTTLRFIVEAAKDLSWWTDFNYVPTWLYPIPHDYNIQLPTGPAQPLSTANPSTFITATGFSTSLYYHMISELTVGLGYTNVTVQPGPDGQRRNVFYGPGALFSVFLLGHLDEMYLTAAGRRSAESRNR